MKRIRTFFKLDLALASRDSVAIYSLVSPLLLALVVRLVIPGVASVNLRFAVDQSVSPTVVERLQEFGDVESYLSRDEVEERVNENDDVPGIINREGEYVILLEGNEDDESGVGMEALVADATGTRSGVSFQTTDLEGSPAPIAEYGATLLAMLSLFIGGIIVGFNVVEEKEGGAIRALAVSPLRMAEYITARAILALIVGCVGGIAATLIVIGPTFGAGPFALAIAASLFVALPFGFIIGAFADNQMTAFALLKLLLAAFMTLPFVSIFVPAGWQWAFYILPNYWMFQSLSNAIVGTAHVGMALSLPLTVVTGVAMIVLLLPKLRRGLRLR